MISRLISHSLSSCDMSQWYLSEPFRKCVRCWKWMATPLQGCVLSQFGQVTLKIGVVVPLLFVTIATTALLVLEGIIRLTLKVSRGRSLAAQIKVDSSLEIKRMMDERAIFKALDAIELQMDLLVDRALPIPDHLINLDKFKQIVVEKGFDYIAELLKTNQSLFDKLTFVFIVNQCENRDYQKPIKTALLTPLCKVDSLTLLIEESSLPRDVAGIVREYAFPRTLAYLIRDGLCHQLKHFSEMGFMLKFWIIYSKLVEIDCIQEFNTAVFYKWNGAVPLILTYIFDKSKKNYTTTLLRDESKFVRMCVENYNTLDLPSKTLVLDLLKRCGGSMPTLIAPLEYNSILEEDLKNHP